jgi:choline dehydrogenase-like flavoprotein
MQVDAMIFENFESIKKFPFDICILGSGPVGITLGLELARRGVRVLIIESGARTRSRSAQELSRATILDRKVHDDLTISVSRQLGGTSNLWGARCQPFDEVDFDNRAEVEGARWPIPFDELAPYYERAAEYAKCGPSSFSIPSEILAVSDDTFTAARIERYSNIPKFQKAHEDLLETLPNLGLFLNTTAISFGYDADGTVIDLLLRSVGSQDQRLPVKHVIIAMGGLETTRFLLGLQKDRRHLFNGRNGPLGRYYMAHVVGEVSNIVWSSEAFDSAFDFFVEQGTYVRRRLTPSRAAILEHNLPNVAFWPVVFPVADARHRSAILSMVYLVFSIGPLGRLLVAEVIRRYHAPKKPKLPHILNVLRGFPAALTYGPKFIYRRFFEKTRLPGFFIRNQDRTYGLSFHAEHFPSANSRVWLSDENDELGMPRLIVDFKFAHADAYGLSNAHKLLDRWLRDNNLGKIVYRQDEAMTEAAILDVAEHGTHHIGTTRMAGNRDDGVVDANLQIFDLPNVFVASSSVFPTSSQANPTLTAVALAVRLADHLVTHVLSKEARQS